MSSNPMNNNSCCCEPKQRPGALQTKKRVVILGSTGSIGENALRVAATMPDRIEIVGLAARINVDRLLEQARQFNVRHIAIADAKLAETCAAAKPHGITIHGGDKGVTRLAALPDADIVLCALVGMAGLRSVLSALESGKDVALATKEVLVAAGKTVMETAAKHNARLLPVDSEHSAIFQCIDGHPAKEIRRLILTASGGPFATRHNVDFDKVTAADALNHPRWNMGRKVTVDSATLMNKGLEIMEAHWLFGIPYDRIDVVIHPESIVHSMVEFVDGSVLAQLSPPDMRFAIQHALTYPDRVDGSLPRLDLANMGSLHFTAPDINRFPCLRLARHAAVTGGTMPAVLNAANEIAVERFLAGQLTFSGIWHTVEAVMNLHQVVTNPTLEAIDREDHWARQEADRHCRLASKA
jgi:1-deoxy-D-xylulose-5-phosphate reductoisomerase